MEEEREVCTGLHNGETTPSQLHEARCAGSPSCLSSRCTKDANLTPVLDLCSPAAGFPACCPKLVTKLSRSCPLSIFLISPPMLQALFLVRPLLVLLLLRDLPGRLLAGPCLCVLDHNDPSKPLHRLTNGPEPSKTIESDGSNIKKPS